MSQLRRDPADHSWTIFLDDLDYGPSSYEICGTNIRNNDICPLCHGQEAQTTPEIMALRPKGGEKNKGGWTIRVVPNMYPALRIEGELIKRGDGPYDSISGIGAHELIIESPVHNEGLGDFSRQHISELIRVFLSRYQDLRRDSRFKYISIFKNYGQNAGATLEHSHTQLIALPVVPKKITQMMDIKRNYFQRKDRCLFCDIVMEEKQFKNRLILEDESFLAFVPFAVRAPFGIMILPKKHQHNFSQMDEKEIWDLSGLLRILLRKMDDLLNYPPYNLILNNAPLSPDGQDFFHWHIDILPRIVNYSGFDWLSGFHTNTTTPEKAARFYREI